MANICSACWSRRLPGEGYRNVVGRRVAHLAKVILESVAFFSVSFDLANHSDGNLITVARLLCESIARH